MAPSGQVGNKKKEATLSLGLEELEKIIKVLQEEIGKSKPSVKKVNRLTRDLLYNFLLLLEESYTPDRLKVIYETKIQNLMWQAAWLARSDRRYYDYILDRDKGFRDLICLGELRLNEEAKEYMRKRFGAEGEEAICSLEI